MRHTEEGINATAILAFYSPEKLPGPVPVSRNTAPAAPAPNIGLSGIKKGLNRHVQSVNMCDASTSSIVSNGASKSW